MKSYVDIAIGYKNRAIEFSRLFKKYWGMDVEKEVDDILSEMRLVENTIKDITKRDLRNGKILEIGCSQKPYRLMYLGKYNKAIGIDLDVMPTNWHSYVHLLKNNGLIRLLKMVIRKLIGIDKKMLVALMKIIKVSNYSIQYMNASKMSFDNQSFDYIYSRSVFEHLDDPERVLIEIKRVLKPFGCVYIVIHLYSSDSGCHDINILTNNRTNIPYWSHLRPNYKHLITENTYLNRLSLSEWEELFLKLDPSVTIIKKTDSKAVEELKKIRQFGELLEYTDEELTTTALIFVVQLVD